jgi:hypothetical protein
MLCCAAMAALIAGATAAPSATRSGGALTPEAAADAVTALPGWESDAGAALPLPSKHFSGYLPVGDGSDDRQIHYYHIEAEVEPEKAPLILCKFTSNPPCVACDLWIFLTENLWLQG